MAKLPLTQIVYSNEPLNVIQLETELLKVVATLNQGPLNARVFSQDDYHTVCSIDFLSGKMNGYNHTKKIILKDKLIEA